MKPARPTDSPDAQAIITYNEFAKMRDDIARAISELARSNDKLRDDIKQLRDDVDTLLARNTELQAERTSG
jgi:outer membrane murein-binding lipoprotein Lpp